MKRLSNKYGKNSRNNKFFKILLLQRQKAKKGFVKSANFAKIAKVTGIFLAKWKDWVTNVAKIARITNLTKILHLEREKVKKKLKKSHKCQDFTLSKIFLTQSVNDMQWRFKFRRLTHSHLGILRKSAPLVRGNAFNFEYSSSSHKFVYRSYTSRPSGLDAYSLPRFGPERKQNFAFLVTFFLLLGIYTPFF